MYCKAIMLKKSTKYFQQKERRYHSLNYLLKNYEKPVQQEGAPGTHKTTRQIARETGISRRSLGRIIHKDNQRKCLKKWLKHGPESNGASLIKQLVSGDIVLMRVSKPKANTLNICCDVLFVTLNLSWRLMLALLWLWTVWHMLWFTRQCNDIH